jgi:hypothetical protein
MARRETDLILLGVRVLSYGWRTKITLLIFARERTRGPLLTSPDRSRLMV